MTSGNEEKRGFGKKGSRFEVKSFFLTYHSIKVASVLAPIRIPIGADFGSYLVSLCVTGS